MNARDVTTLLGAITIVAVVTVIVSAEEIPGTVDAIGKLFVNSLAAMTGTKPGERILR